MKGGAFGINWEKVIGYFIVSIPVSAIYYLLLANMVFLGDDARLLKENRQRAKDLDTLQHRLETLDGAVKSLQTRDGNIYKAIFGTYPPEDLYKEDLGHNIELSQAVALASDVAVSIDSIKSKLDYLGPSSDHIPSIIPVEGCGKESVGASMGRKMNPFIKSVVWHSGADIIAEEGTPVISPADGIVTSVAQDRAAGTVVELDHLNGYTTRYYHLQDITVKRGDTLSRAQRFAAVGTSGRSMAPHLHYEVLLDGKKINPVYYFFSSLNPSEYSYALHKSENAGQSLD